MQCEAEINLPVAFQQALRDFLPAENIIQDLAQRLALSGDASFYRLTPELVVRVDNISQLSRLLKFATDHLVPVTFRAAGTSLCGQAVTDSVLVVLSQNWRGAEVLDEGARIRLQPGIIGAQANKLLQPWGRKIGPDPASIDSCKIGGIAANNASGMCCGVKQNSYHTLCDLTLVMADGSVLDTADAESVKAFESSHGPLLDGLKVLHQQVKEDGLLAEKIRHKYRLKNTTGYGINSLLDFEQPLDILKHLLIGSEGTLGFIADITYHTVVDERDRASGLFIFNRIDTCCELVSRLRQAPVAAVELMDARALKSVAGKPAMPPGMDALNEQAAALLIEVTGDCAQVLTEHLEEIEKIIAPYTDELIGSVAFSQDKARNQELWAIRKGTFPAVGAVRPSGTTVIIEDVAFPVPRLADGVEALHRLFHKHGYNEAIIFGHALEGNLHFVFTQAFNTEAEIRRYQDFMQDLSELVTAGFGGSLKAEHGTGRNMAPFVKMEWGDAAYTLMERIKALFDPDGILNPGVILNADDKAHIRHLKPIPALDPELDKCIECGFCEPVCPSKDLTLTPRQRIALWRQIQAGEYSPQTKQQLQQAYQYLGVDTCAATGLCAQRCPVGINTGDFIKQLRAQKPKGEWIAKQVASHFAGTTRVARFALNSVDLSRNTLGETPTQAIFKGLNKLSGGAIPKWYPAWPKAAIKNRHTAVTSNRTQPAVVYFPSCTNRMFATDAGAEDQRPLQEVIAAILEKAGFRVLVPDDIDQLCCGTPWDSKGHNGIADDKASQSMASLARLAKAEGLPVLVDASPCAMQLNHYQLKQPGSDVKLYETAEFLYRFVVPKLEISPQKEPVTLHITCSSRRMHTEQYLLDLTRACTEQVIVPQDIYCCGFAGDKGFYTPELNASALADLSGQIPSGCSQGVSNSRSCEIGLHQHSGIPFQSVAYLLDRVSTSKCVD
ncbi:FAD-binding and (Fe-S)-binding domain-containing protein [Lacimicrobium alkaliphilum]|uniref:D-lactate dehydrogenase (cytochrome) n=1 Tax=Lacimicrobium alkaliphilum TaxID=1526571 RepID=A0ABQ1QYS1_9ALTE|nr:FAD-binding and (Fe-S)-binding domain-containing protein [Lacimicrobium alkaliphilum]GGD51380.1 ferredoxin [Lacimicrobium alkaliphilum]